MKELNMKNTARKTTLQKISRKDMQPYFNREINLKRCNEWLKKYNGWDPARAGTIDVAKVVNDKLEQNGKYFRWDGSHREKMHEIHFGDDNLMMDASVTEVSSMEEISDLYASKNQLSGKHKPEEVFVHEWNAGYPEALETHNNLIQSKLKVDVGTGLIPGDQTGRAISSIKIFEKTVARYGIQRTVKASQLLQDSFDDTIPAEFLEGVCCAMEHADNYYDDHKSNNKNKIKKDYEKAFKDSFKVQRSVHTNKKKVAQRVATDYKQQGGNIHAHSAQSIAIGILKTVDGNTMHYANNMVEKIKKELI